ARTTRKRGYRMTDVKTRHEAHTITGDDLRTLVQPQPSGGPCISIYIHTAPAANADQGRIRFKSALQRVQQDLKKNQQPGQHEEFLQPLRELEDDSEFWLSQKHALAIFYSRDAFHVRRLPEPIADDVTVVADSFHIKPLIRFAQHSARVPVLAISVEHVALYGGRLQKL